MGMVAVKPVVTVSKCLGFAACRYNAVTIPCGFVEALKPFVEFRTVCPEMEIGLGAPREPIRILQSKQGLRLMQSKTGRDLTSTMHTFSRSCLDGCGGGDGFILKYKSPSCGLREAKRFTYLEGGGVVGRGLGFFGQAVVPNHPE